MDNHLRLVLLSSPFYREAMRHLAAVARWVCCGGRTPFPYPPTWLSWIHFQPAFLPHHCTLSNYFAILLFIQITHIYKSWPCARHRARPGGCGGTWENLCHWGAYRLSLCVVSHLKSSMKRHRINKDAWSLFLLMRKPNVPANHVAILWAE